MIKAVLFDLDLTLLDRDASVRKFVETQHERFNFCLSHIPKETYVSRFIELDERGYVWKDIVYQRLIDEFNINGINWEQLLEDYVSEFHKSCIPYPNLIEMLERLNRENFKLGLITNALGDFQFRNIKAIGIDKYFDVILISEWEGIKKPNPEIFFRALDKLEVEAEESIYIGDHPINDVQASRNVGMKGVWKKDPQWEIPLDVDGIISDLLEVPELVKSLINRTSGQ
ncbi:HAD family hydrolase [Paenibacillus sp. sptzw28]|uniref:HAD family hydrolase n=1 Tax=Paenibacillus sp. sptzw28 TaxID=715179 RepID=UPI001C6F0C70|nr:HAD-IA family hydrolase [Paenibacillus sp. sptzw28]QYR24156.1 HAD family hydrolase [Paenibacillus sp. sptzw28]